MSETIQGILEEIAIVKKSEPGKKAWTLRKITVDGEKYSTFDMIKATKGSTVEFEFDVNDKGYKDVVKNSFRVLKEATPEETKATETKVSANKDVERISIENQVALKCAVEFSAGFDLDSDEALKLAVKAYGQFASLLHSQAGSSAKAAAAKPKQKPTEPEDENQDETPDY